MQLPPEQTRPTSHALPTQHGRPAAPQFNTSMTTSRGPVSSATASLVETSTRLGS
jgi:hypothetical protein